MLLGEALSSALAADDALGLLRGQCGAGLDGPVGSDDPERAGFGDDGLLVLLPVLELLAPHAPSLSRFVIFDHEVRSRT
jgi:hypothetical protein